MGKSGSKLKPKNRSQSIAWSFRFASLGSLSRRGKASLSTPVARPHIDTQRWLSILDLQQYADLFSKYPGVEDFINFSEGDIKELGVRNSSHRARLMSSLVALRAKYEKAGARKADKAQRHSMAVDPRRLIHMHEQEDILVVSNVVQSKSLCNITMDEPSGDPTVLRRLLDWELSLDSQDLRSHAWYHGAIPRHRAEEIVERDGDFLVRDCASQPGNFVLTCRHKGAALHFVINKCVLQPDTVYERVQYQFEADAYDTVPDLVTFYVGSGKPISAASGARIQSPRNRLYPLSFYAEKYALQGIAGVTAAACASPMTSPLTPLTPVGARMSPYSCFRSPVHSPPRSRRAAAEVPPRLPTKQRSHSLTPSEAGGRLTLSLAVRPDDRGGSADGVIGDPPGVPVSAGGHGKFSTHSLPRGASSGKLSMPRTATMPRNGTSKLVRVNSDLECVERRSRFVASASMDVAPVEQEHSSTEAPPPKPSRVPSMLRSPSKDGEDDGRLSAGGGDDTTPVSESGSSLASAAALQRVASYHASGSDSGNGSGDSAQSSAAGDVPDSASQVNGGGAGGSGTLTRGVVIKNPRYHCGLSTSCSSTTLKAPDESMIAPADVPDLPSVLDPDFHTFLLPAAENKPLDATALHGIKAMLVENGSRILANHLTRTDLDLTVAERAPGGRPWDDDLNLGIKTGIELCSLPFGKQLRLDLVERTECLKLLVAVTILTCAHESERAELLNKWIQVAVDTKTALGNLYGFCGIMLGLCMPQVQRLSATWHILRQRYTDSAVNFEAKLRPTLKSMNECSNPQAPNTTIPHLLPFLLLNARTMEAPLNGSCVTPSGSGLPLSTLNACIAPWESSTSDFGLGTLFAHLESARRFGDSLPTFKRNSEIVLGGSKVDDLLLDAFRTEFHLKFLWGSRGASVHAEERHAKFDQVLTVMSEKCEPPPTPVQPLQANGFASPGPLQHQTSPSIGTSV